MIANSDTRAPWQITASIRLQTAVGYLCLLALDDHRKQVYETAYRTENLNKWIENHVSRIVTLVNRTVEKHGQGCVVRSVAGSYAESLAARGLSGLVIAGGIHTGKARRLTNEQRPALRTRPVTPG